jgi:hypothetical protein
MSDIPIFDREHCDGLTERIQASYRLRILARATQAIKPAGFSLSQIPARAGLTDFDLYHLRAVLCTAGGSAGWNKNDDVFDAAETWAARATPLHKPVNYNHAENDVIGHIVASSILSDGKEWTADTAPSDPFDIVVASVLYRKQEDPDRQKRMDDLIQGIAAGDWFVSMECLLVHFDYAVAMKDGSIKSIARNQQTAFLTKHLRLYGGSGEYNGHKIGRLLRNYVFSGMGMVQTPANDRSIILPAADAQPVVARSFGLPEEICKFWGTVKTDKQNIRAAARWIGGIMEK